MPRVGNSTQIVGQLPPPRSAMPAEIFRSAGPQPQRLVHLPVSAQQHSGELDFEVGVASSGVPLPTTPTTPTGPAMGHRDRQVSMGSGVGAGCPDNIPIRQLRTLGRRRRIGLGPSGAAERRGLHRPPPHDFADVGGHGAPMPPAPQPDFSGAGAEEGPS